MDLEPSSGRLWLFWPKPGPALPAPHRRDDNSLEDYELLRREETHKLTTGLNYKVAFALEGRLCVSITCMIFFLFIYFFASSVTLFSPCRCKNTTFFSSRKTQTFSVKRHIFLHLGVYFIGLHCMDAAKKEAALIVAFKKHFKVLWFLVF